MVENREIAENMSGYANKFHQIDLKWFIALQNNEVNWNRTKKINGSLL